MIATPVEAELAGYLAQSTDVRTEAGHAAFVRNGHHPARPFQTGIGPVSVHIPICLSVTLRTQSQDVGSRAAVAESKGDFQWRDGRGPQGSSRL